MGLALGGEEEVARQRPGVGCVGMASLPPLRRGY